MPTFSMRAALALLVVVLAAGWLLLGGGGEDPAPSAEESPAQVPDTDRPTPPEPPAAPPPEAPPVAPPAVEPPPVAAPPEPAVPPTEYLAPELLKFPHARWDDAPALDVLYEVARQARLQLVMPGSVKRLLASKRVSIDLQNTTGAIVISRVLVPHSLSYTVRGQRVVIFVDDD